MITTRLEGAPELQAALDRIADPRRTKAIVRGGMLRGMTAAVRSVRSLIPPATTPKHSTQSIKTVIGKRFAMDKVTHFHAAKVGVNVGLQTQRVIDRMAEKAAAAGKNFRKRTAQTPHAHLYIAGTDLRWSGFKEMGRSRGRVVASTLTPSGRIRVSRRGEFRRTKNPIRFHGRVQPKDYVTRGVEMAWPQIVDGVRASVLKACAKELEKQAQTIRLQGSV